MNRTRDDVAKDLSPLSRSKEESSDKGQTTDQMSMALNNAASVHSQLLVPLCSPLTLLQPQMHFLHVPGTWLACFHLSPLLAIPMVWYRHIFLSFFLQIFALRSPYQRGIPDHIFQLSIAAYQITPKQWLQATFYIAYNFVGGEFGQGLAGSLYWNWYR